MTASTVDAWLNALAHRHLAQLTAAEVARALKALSTRYVERRSTLASGAALDSAGKRAAFALYYGPVHFVTLSRILRNLPSALDGVGEILDVGCGTGAAGAAWAHEAGSTRILGMDRHPWAVAEANWTYRQLQLRGRASQSDVRRLMVAGGRQKAVLLAYTVNELLSEVRDALLPRLLSAHARGAHLLVVEPIARRGVADWWDVWAEAFRAVGGREDEWRFPSELPARQRDLARAAGLDPRELTARTLYGGR